MSSMTTTTTNMPLHEERPRRSLFSVPGADERKLEKARSLQADAVVLDLEDGVAYDQKDVARAMVTQTLLDSSKSFGNAELCVRINALDTGDLAIQDLEAILACGRLQAIVIPKVESPDDIQFVRQKMHQVQRCHPQDVRIIAAIESAKGMLNLRQIAETSCEKTDVGKLDALVFASEDYCADLEAIRTPLATELLWARSQLVTTAKAYQLQAIDMVHIDFRNLEALATECVTGRQLGFTGKQAIHPNQLETIHKEFSPSLQDLQFATNCRQQYEAAVSKGKGACEVDGIVVDMPVYKWAIKICQRAEKAGMSPTTTTEE